MPKSFRILLEVEEAALGPIMSLMNRTPGVISFDPIFDRKAHPFFNGHAKPKAANGEDKPHGEEKKPRKARVVKGITGAKLILKLLAEKPMQGSEISKIFEKDGRSATSHASVIHTLRTEGVLQSGPNGYSLTKKGRDRARYV